MQTTHARIGYYLRLSVIFMLLAAVGWSLPHLGAAVLASPGKAIQTIRGTLNHGRISASARSAASAKAMGGRLLQTAIIVSAGATLVSESCTPANGAIDPNETVTISFCVQNTGSGNTTNLIGTLQTTGGVTSPSGPQNYGVLVAGGPPVCRNFTFTASGSCGGTITATLQFQDGATNLGTVTYTFTLGTQSVAFTQNFDGVVAPALPAGWSSTFVNGASCALGAPWVTSNAGTPAPPADTAPNAAFHDNQACITDNLLDSPVIAITSNAARLTFRNNFDLEDPFDGGVLEIKIGAGAFTDIITAGGSFVTGGYTDNISINFSSPISGRQAWSGNSGGFITTTVNLPAAAAGQNIQLRWRLATDNSVSTGTGWRVDTISVTDGFTCATTCPPPACTITCPANITVSNDPNQCGSVVTYPAPTTTGTCGTVTCSPPSGSFFPKGTTLITCTATAGPSCGFTITVNDTQPPLITCPANITASNDPNQCGAVVNYPAPTVSDNCPMIGAPVCSPASGSFFPRGTTTVTCTVADMSGNTATCSFTVRVNDTQPPSITCPADIYLATAGTSATATYTPTASDNCPGVTVACTPPSGSSFPVGSNTVTCTATDATGITATCSFRVIVNPVTFSVTDPLACTGPGNAVTGTFTITNNGAASVTVGALVALPATLPAVPGSCVANTGTCSVLTAMLVNYTATLAPGQTAVVSYTAQVGDTVVTGTTLCSLLGVSLNGGPTLNVQACTTVNCPTVGPGLLYPATGEVNDQKAGSVLVYNLYSSSIAAPNQQNTRISLTNTNPGLSIAVHLFFVDGATCSIADSLVCLTPNQTASFLASDIDPGTTGYIVAVASDLVTGCPVNFNYLIGDEYVKLSSGHAANLAAESFAALAGGLPACNGLSVTALLSFDGTSYNRAPRVLAASNVPSRADGNDTLIVLNRLGGSLAAGASTLGSLFGILYDDAENPLSFTFTAGVCQFRSSLSSNFPRTAPRFEQFIPAGRSGWAKFYSLSDIGLLGAQLNFNANAGTAANAFNQGHNLHKLTLTSSAVLTIPIFPPNC